MQENPYVAPNAPMSPMHDGMTGNISPADADKIEAIIKDANQFWLALLVCLFCSCIGVLIIVPWYGVRLAQWSKFANLYPALIVENAPTGSMAARFKAAKAKLLAGILGGIFLLGVVIILNAVFLAVGSVDVAP